MISDWEPPAFIVVSAGDIAERAYAFYIERGRADGFDRDDWLRAERELKTAPSIAPGTDSAKGGNTGKRRRR